MTELKVYQNYSLLLFLIVSIISFVFVFVQSSEEVNFTFLINKVLSITTESVTLTNPVVIDNSNNTLFYSNVETKTNLNYQLTEDQKQGRYLFLSHNVKNQNEQNTGVITMNEKSWNFNQTTPQFTITGLNIKPNEYIFFSND